MKLKIAATHTALFLATAVSLFAQTPGLSIPAGATFSLGAARLSLPGDWRNAGTFQPGTGTVLFTGATADQNIHDVTAVTFHNLTVHKSGGNLILHDPIAVDNLLTVTQGDIDLNGQIITLNPAATLSETPGHTVKGASGYLTTTRTLSAPDNLNVAGLGARLTTAADLGVTEIRRGHAAQTGNGQTGITRYFDIVPAQNSGLNAELAAFYDESELNGLSESSLKLFRSTDAGATWTQRDGTLNSAQNSVTLAGIDALSRWTLAAHLAAYDCGDAPDPTYATLLSSNGARHFIVPGLRLGALVDDDLDGQPHAEANGDDHDGSDDEEGISIPALVLGQSLTLDVTVANSTGNPAYLNAWIDWNCDGLWNSSDEHVAIGRPVSDGHNDLTINVPFTASPGLSFARFRLSTTQTLTTTGSAPDGEVEDYQVSILSPTVLVWTHPNGGSLNIGDPLSLTWLPGENATRVDLFFSADGGTHWLSLAEGVANSGAYTTFVPGIATTNALFKIVNTANAAEYDVSNDVVTITGADWQTHLIFEAENGALSAPMRPWINGTAFECGAIYSDRNNIGKAVYTVNITTPGLYVLWGRAQAPGGTRNSFWVSCDGGTEHLWEIRKGDGLWYWQKLSEPDVVLFHLAAGSHQITIRCRENYTRLDRIVLSNDLAATFHWMNPERWVQILAPHDSVQVVKGESYEIRWQSYRIADQVTIDLSFDFGVTFPLVISAATANDGSFMWQVPFLSQEDATLRIREAGHSGCPWDVMWGKFDLAAPSPRLWVMTPNGGDTLFAGDTCPVGWRSRAFSGLVDLHYSTDNGTSWLPLASGQPDSGIFAWVVPNTATDSALIRVIAAGAMAPGDSSDTVFTILIKEEPPPPPDYALAFDGRNDFVQVAHHATLNVSNRFTIAFWFKTGDPGQKWRRILEKGAFDEYYISFYGATERMCGAFRTVIPGGSRMNNIVGPSASAIPADDWVHAALTFDGAETRLYLNGRLETTHTAKAAPRDLLKDLVIGAARHGSIYEYHYQGLLDELSLWNIARNETEISRAPFESLTGNEAGLVAYYKFDQGAGQQLFDSAPYANHGRLGALAMADDSDPLWVESDRPHAMTSLARLAPATKELDDEDMPETDIALPQTVTLEQNFPNPFNPVTAISYQLPGEMQVRLRIFDLQGHEIARLADGQQPAGRYSQKWDAAGMPSGLYFYCLEAGPFREIRRMLLLK